MSIGTTKKSKYNLKTFIKLNLNFFWSAATRNFQGRVCFIELGHFDNDFVGKKKKKQEKKEKEPRYS